MDRGKEMNRYGVSFVLILSLFFSSCATKELWSNARYKEVVENFLISSDGKKLVVVGKKYHYIFDLESDLKEILLSERKEKLVTLFDTFKIGENNKIEGHYILYYETKRDHSDQDLEWFRQKGFVKSEKNHWLSKEIDYYKKGRVSGTRYLADKELPLSRTFNKQYCIQIEEPFYKYEEQERILATPIAITLDGAIVVGVTALFVMSHGSGFGGSDPRHTDLEGVNRHMACGDND